MMRSRTTWSSWWCSSRCICLRCKGNSCHPPLSLEACNPNNKCKRHFLDNNNKRWSHQLDSSELNPRWTLSSPRLRLRMEVSHSLRPRKSQLLAVSLANSLAKSLSNSSSNSLNLHHFQLHRCCNQDQLRLRLIVYSLKKRRQSISKRLTPTYFWSNSAVWRILVRWRQETPFFAPSAKPYLISIAKLPTLWALRCGIVSSVSLRILCN